MRHAKLVGFLTASVLVVGTALAQTSDWQAVKDLPDGTKISVTAKHRFINTTCVFHGASDEKLLCELVGHRPFLPSQVAFPRESVRQVRREHSDLSNALLGLAIGAGVGAAIGANATGDHTPRARAGAAVIVGGIGGMVGGFVGKAFPLVHGKVVYRHPEPKK